MEGFEANNLAEPSRPTYQTCITAHGRLPPGIVLNMHCWHATTSLSASSNRGCSALYIWCTWKLFSTFSDAVIRRANTLTTNLSSYLQMSCRNVPPRPISKEATQVVLQMRRSNFPSQQWNRKSITRALLFVAISRVPHDGILGFNMLSPAQNGQPISIPSCSGPFPRTCPGWQGSTNSSCSLLFKELFGKMNLKFSDLWPSLTKDSGKKKRGKTIIVASKSKQTCRSTEVARDTPPASSRNLPGSGRGASPQHWFRCPGPRNVHCPGCGHQKKCFHPGHHLNALSRKEKGIWKPNTKLLYLCVIPTDIFSDIFSLILSGILPGILPDILSDILSGIFSGILSDILADIRFGLTFYIILSGIFSRTLSAFSPIVSLAFYLALF